MRRVAVRYGSYGGRALACAIYPRSTNSKPSSPKAFLERLVAQTQNRGADDRGGPAPPFLAHVKRGRRTFSGELKEVGELDLSRFIDGGCGASPVPCRPLSPAYFDE